MACTSSISAIFIGPAQQFGNIESFQLFYIKKKKKSFKFQTLHQYCWIIKVHTYYHYQRDIILKKQIFNVYKSVNFFFLFFPPPPRNEPRITPIAQWTVKNKFRIDHNDTIPLTKLSWPSNQQNSKHWRKLSSLILLRGFMKVKKKKNVDPIIDTIFSHRLYVKWIFHRFWFWSI